MVGTYQAAITIVEGKATSTFTIAHPNKNLFISITSAIDKTRFDQILSTFTFTPVNCTGKCPQLMPPAPD